MKSYWITVHPKSYMTDILTKREDGDTKAQGRLYVTADVETGVMKLQTKEC